MNTATPRVGGLQAATRALYAASYGLAFWHGNRTRQERLGGGRAALAAIDECVRALLRVRGQLAAALQAEQDAGSVHVDVVLALLDAERRAGS